MLYLQDSRDWEALTGNEQHFISMILAFFAASDGIVMENLVSTVLCHINTKNPALGVVYTDTMMLLVSAHIKAATVNASTLVSRRIRLMQQP